MQINYSPGVALNRVYAVYKVKGKQAALKDAIPLNLTNSHFYHLLLGELYQDLDNENAKTHYGKALVLARMQPEKQGIHEKLTAPAG